LLIGEPRSADSVFKNIPLETWQEHSLRTVRVFEEKILPEEDFVIQNWLSGWVKVRKWF
jgi:hypothetical protein